MFVYSFKHTIYTRIRYMYIVILLIVVHFSVYTVMCIKLLVSRESIRTIVLMRSEACAALSSCAAHNVLKGVRRTSSFSLLLQSASLVS
jgi:hypothetical protein